MTQQRTELIMQVIAMLIAALVPVFYMLYPDKLAEIDTIAGAVQAVLVAIGILVVGWTTVNFARTRSYERQEVVRMVNYWARHQSGEIKDGEVVGAVQSFEFLE